MDVSNDTDGNDHNKQISKKNLSDWFYKPLIRYTIKQMKSMSHNGTQQTFV